MRESRSVGFSILQWEIEGIRKKYTCNLYVGVCARVWLSGVVCMIKRNEIVDGGLRVRPTGPGTLTRLKLFRVSRVFPRALVQSYPPLLILTRKKKIKTSHRVKHNCTTTCPSSWERATTTRKKNFLPTTRLSNIVVITSGPGLRTHLFSLLFFLQVYTALIPACIYFRPWDHGTFADKAVAHSKMLPSIVDLTRALIVLGPQTLWTFEKQAISIGQINS